MTLVTPNLDKLYYGNYGGCFIADAFTVVCDSLYEEYQRVTVQPKFLTQCRELAARYSPVNIQVEGKAMLGKDIKLHQATFNPYPIIGHALMAKEIGRQRVLFAPRHTEEAIFCAKLCASLNFQLKMNLPTSLRCIQTLTQLLEAMGVELETKLCETFDLPEMYSFQEWLAAPDKSYCVFSRSNVGPFPMPLMTTAFAAPYGTALKEKAGVPKAIVVPCISGSTALTVLKPWFGQGIKLYTVEIEGPDMWEELDSFCGAFTKVMRNRTLDRVLAPELANAWDEGTVERVYITKEQAIEALKQVLNQEGSADLSIESAAALYHAAQLEGDVLVVCGPQRMGAAR